MKKLYGKKILAFVLAMLLCLSVVFTACSRKPQPQPPELPEYEYVDPEEPKPPVTFLPDDDDDEPDIPVIPDIDLPIEPPPPPPIEDDEDEYECLCGFAETGVCSCDTVCTNPEHTKTYNPRNPEFVFEQAKLNVTLADENGITGEQLKAEVFRGITAHDGHGRDITNLITINAVGGVPYNEQTFDWDARAAQFGAILFELSITNAYGRENTQILRITIADIPTITFDYSSFTVENGNIIIYAGETVRAGDIRSALIVTDRFDTALTGEFANISWGGFNETAPGLYTVTSTVINNQGVAASVACVIEVRARPNPFIVSGEQHFTMLKTQDGSAVRAALLAGVTAVDVINGVLTEDIYIHSVSLDGGEPVVGFGAWNSLADVFTVTAVLRVVASAITFNLTRTVTLAATPEILADTTKFDWQLLPNGVEGFSVPFGGSFNIFDAISVSDASDPSLGVQNVQVTGSVPLNQMGIYPLTLTVQNIHGYSSQLVLHVWVRPLAGTEIVVTINESPNIKMLKGTGAQLQSRILQGVSAFDGSDEISNEITILSVNGISADLINWDSLANSVGTHTVLIGVPNKLGEYGNTENDDYIIFTRFVTIATVPEISFNTASLTLTAPDTVQLVKGDVFDYAARVSVSDESDTSLTSNDIRIEIYRVTGADTVSVRPEDFSTQETGTYILTFTAANAAGFTAETLILNLNIVPPTPVLWMAAGQPNITVSRTDGATFRELVLSGVAAHDGANIPVTEIDIFSVGGVEVDNSFNWGAAADTMGDVQVVLFAINDYGVIGYLARTVSIVDIPVIRFDLTRFVLEDGLIRAFRGEPFEFISALSVTDALDPDLSVEDIVVTGSVNTAVNGNYTLIFNVINKNNIPAASVEVTVRVRDKLMGDFTPFEIYDIIQERLLNSHYTTQGHTQAGWSGGAYSKRGFFHNSITRSSADEYYHTYRTAGWQMYFVAVYGDFNSAREFTYNKDSGSMFMRKAKIERNSSRNEFYRNNAWTIAADQWNPSAMSDAEQFESEFGRPFMQDSEFFVTPETASASFQNLGSNRFSVTFTMNTPGGSRDNPGIAGRYNSLVNQMENVSFDNYTRGVLTYVFDGNFRVETKRVQETYSMCIDYAAIYATVTSDMTQNYVYDAVQPSTTSASVNVSSSIPNEVGSDAPVSSHTHEDGEDDGEYCACGCCSCCDTCFPKDEDGNVKGREPIVRPNPVITFPSEELVIQRGHPDDTFQRLLYTGIEAHDGFGNDIIVYLHAINGVATTEAGFSWTTIANTVGWNTVTYYAVNMDTKRFVFVDRQFLVGTAPVMTFSASLVETVTVEVNGAPLPRSAIVVMLNSSFNPLSFVQVSDESDPSLTTSSIVVEGSVDPRAKGVYTLTYRVTNASGMTARSTMFYFVRDRYPTEISSALEAYARIAEELSVTDFISESKGNGMADNNAMTIYSTRQKRGNETFFQNLSNGGTIWGVNADFARRVYRNGDSYRYQRSEGGFSSSNGVVTVGRNGWGNLETWSRATFEERFGRQINDVTNYKITQTSVKDPNARIMGHGNGVFSIKFDINIDRGINSEGVAGYVRQIPTMSGGKTCEAFYEAIITITFGMDFRPTQISTYERYLVNSGILNVKPVMTATIIDTYSYPATVNVTTF
ncbi:MAG: DUF5011 domain-containing protein [Firmicutes bacterium]|nr:DUF5011 domain-containing protein [Bacillota bacterium]